MLSTLGSRARLDATLQLLKAAHRHLYRFFYVLCCLVEVFVACAEYLRIKGKIGCDSLVVEGGAPSLVQVFCVLCFLEEIFVYAEYMGIKGKIGRDSSDITGFAPSLAQVFVSVFFGSRFFCCVCRIVWDLALDPGFFGVFCFLVWVFFCVGWIVWDRQDQVQGCTMHELFMVHDP